MPNLSYSTFPILSLAIWCPVFFGLLILLTGKDERATFVRYLALLGAAASFVVTLPLAFHFDRSAHGLQFVERHSWIRLFRVEYALGVDGISMWFVLLTALITLIVVLAGWKVIQTQVAQYMGAFLILSGLMIGVFSTFDGLLFYVFFEATLIPMFVIIGIWGGERRVYAAFKFFLYTFFGSLPMLIAILYLYLQTNSFNIFVWYKAPLPLYVQIWLFIAFLTAFAVKVPMWPVHTWLPDAHVEAPTGGSVILAAIMLKLGAYGFIRFSLPILPDASRYLAWLMIVLSLVAVTYIGLVALVQKDMKKLIAYSSIAHMGFVTLGFFLFENITVDGALVQMISHGFVSAAMFLCVGVLYDRMHTRHIGDYGGVVHVMPRFAAFFVLFAFANCGLPGTSGFVGEVMVILGAVSVNVWVAAVGALALILGASYTLWMIKRVLYGPIESEEVASLKDIGAREFFILAVLGAFVLAIGIYPAWVTDVMQVSVSDLLAHVAQSKL
ncbi:NADH-quinone oxidoreductase subunit M [Oxalobacter paraformigenes]|uniref:Proton-translocating NADH-quinone oxidoreductase, chain M n=1 Tax=Oxalobacter paraformigenes TaxID=556268 RepID=C3X4P5_9BURK|nr:NADH-quinone oxidoreductase subunit M [Oxalobacter paraformigenes]EEO28181.1 proton-translocating NADH-quinone oxidoreductase, chain M [Oxalobacter paraformigenes]